MPAAGDGSGPSPQLLETVVVPLLRPLYQHWFRVEASGIAHIPEHGSAMLVSNHSGGLWPLDAAMTALAVHLEHPAARFLRMLGGDLLFDLSGVDALADACGAVRATSSNARELLDAGELVGVWPEGYKGIGKRFDQRYQLQRFGRGGFVQAALRCGAPIIPVSVVGAEEAHPVLGDAPALATTLGLPYFPLTPTFPWLGPLGLVPLPSKWLIDFGEPIATDGYGAGAADDPIVVFDLTDRVRETIQATLYRLLARRSSVWR